MRWPERDVGEDRGGDATILGSRTRFFGERSKVSTCPAVTPEASTSWDTPSKKHKDRVEDVSVPLSTKQLILSSSSGPLRGANDYKTLEDPPSDIFNFHGQ